MEIAVDIDVVDVLSIHCRWGRNLVYIYARWTQDAAIQVAVDKRQRSVGMSGAGESFIEAGYLVAEQQK